MSIPQIIKELLENGVHFGHLSKHWNPKMKKFIFVKKKNIYIIDLEKTAEKLEEAREFLKNVVQKGGTVLFVATKKQLSDTIKELASFCNMPYITERWIGGFLTNFSTVRERIKKYMELREKRDRGEFSSLARKEVVRLNRELERMEKYYKGVETLQELPQAIFLVDPKKEIACVKEANILKIPLVALIDTDADPEVIDYPIPGNDDAIKSVRFITLKIAEAIKEGQKNIEVAKREEREKVLESEEKVSLSGIEEIEEKLEKEIETPKRRLRKKEV